MVESVRRRLSDMSLRVSDMLHAQDVHDGFVEHAGGDVDQQEDVIATDLQAGQVLPVAGADEAAHACAGSALGSVVAPSSRRAPCSSDLRSALSRSIASRRDSVSLSESARLDLQALGLAEHARAEPIGPHLLIVGLKHRIAQLYEMLVTLQHLLFQLRDFGALGLRFGHLAQAALRADQRVDEHHRPECTGDAVEERHAEDFSLAARHRRSPVRSARA